jgi:D-xylose reductase
VVCKSVKLERIAENFSIFDFELTSAEVDKIDGYNQDKRFNDPGEFCKGMGGSIPIYA